jgi:hypothetical protein
MKKLFFFCICFLFLSQLSKAQLSEKFLKLNRLVFLDSSKSISLAANTNTLVFKINVPSGVYWKITHVSFTSNIDGLQGYDFLYWMKINNALIPQVENEDVFGPRSESAATSGNPLYSGKEFVRNSSIWAGPGSTIYFLERSPSSFSTHPFTLYLTAEEYYLE